MGLSVKLLHEVRSVGYYRSWEPKPSWQRERLLPPAQEQ